MNPVARKLVESRDSLRSAFGNRNLRRLQLAWIGSIIGTWAYAVALLVYAYGQGGPAAVGLVGVLRYFSWGISAPLLAPLADRFPRRDVMLGADAIRALAMFGAAAVIAAGGPAAAVYALATLTSIAGSPFRPAEKAILPALVTTPDELVASNIASSTFESVGFLLGPALGGLLLAYTNSETVFAVNGLSFVWSACLLLGLPRLWPERRRPAEQSESRIRSVVDEYTGGFSALLGDADLRTMAGLYCAQTVVAGAETVLVVALALDLLRVGDSGLGMLQATVGIGGLLGAFATLSLTGSGRLASVFGVGVLFWGLPFLLVAAWPSVITAAIALAIIGLANTVVDVSALTLMQRVVPDAVLGRVFGVLEGVLLASIGVGAALTPILIEGPGIRVGLVVWGFLPVAGVAIAWRQLRSMDARAAAPGPLALLRKVPFLAPLAAPVLEKLAASAGERRAPAGAVLMSIGDPGDLFYVVESGEVEVLTQAGETVVVGPGGYFGEIALLRNVPRTATVRALTDVLLCTLDRDEFVPAVTGHHASAEAADVVIAERMRPTLSRTLAPRRV